MTPKYCRIGHIKDVPSFRACLAQLGLDLPLDDAILSRRQGSPLAQPIAIGSFRVGNRWCIHPMEGWDALPEGTPGPLTTRRWENFGASGAKLIWGGEALAVVPEGRANPNQLFYRCENESAMRQLLEALRQSHRRSFGPGATDDLLVGLQLTHSGRFSRPNDKTRLEPRIAYHHPLLDKKFGIRPDDDAPLLSDDDLLRLIDRYIEAARMAQRCGFAFVDVKHCHGYLGHELLSAFERPGAFGGDLAGRTRFLRLIVQGIRTACPGLMIGVRLSIFDQPPFMPDPIQTAPNKLGPGKPEAFCTPYPGFGCSRDNPLALDLTEPLELLRLLRDQLQVEAVNLSAGSPYYNPHIQRPAFFPPSDGYQPPEDPLVGCVRQIQVVRQLKASLGPGLPMVGTAYTYFQDFLPHIAQAVVRQGWVDCVGLGRMVLSYWDMPADTLEGKPMQTRRICRTFSDCTTAPRQGLASGCYPLDQHYKQSQQARQLKALKAGQP